MSDRVDHCESFSDRSVAVGVSEVELSRVDVSKYEYL